MDGQTRDLSSLEVMARLTDTKITARTMVNEWLLITYDIPHTKAGDLARREFLANAKRIGANRYTDSVYLMPWNKEAEKLALQLARQGTVCVWTSTATDIAKSAEITEVYDRGLEPLLDDIIERIDKIEGHLFERHLKRAWKMMGKTERMISDLEATIARRGSAELNVLLTLAKRRFELLGE